MVLLHSIPPPLSRSNFNYIYIFLSFYLSIFTASLLGVREIVVLAGKEERRRRRRKEGKVRSLPRCRFLIVRNALVPHGSGRERRVRYLSLSLYLFTKSISLPRCIFSSLSLSLSLPHPPPPHAHTTTTRVICQFFLSQYII